MDYINTDNEFGKSTDRQIEEREREEKKQRGYVHKKTHTHN